MPTSEKCSSTNVFSSKSVLVNGEVAIMSKTAGPDFARSALRNDKSQHLAVCSTARSLCCGRSTCYSGTVEHNLRFPRPPVPRIL